MYTIAQAAARSGLSVYTLRYYDKEGLLPFVERGASGARSFSDRDLNWLSLISCLKNTGMPIKDIRHYVEWYLMGDDTLTLRLDMFTNHREKMLEQMAQLQQYMTKIDKKIEVYQGYVKAGTQGGRRAVED